MADLTHRNGWTLVLLALLAACRPSPARRTPGSGDIDADVGGSGGSGGASGSGGSAVGGTGGSSGAGGSGGTGGATGGSGGAGGSAGAGGTGGRVGADAAAGGADAAAGGAGGRADAAPPPDAPPPAIDMRPPPDLAVDLPPDLPPPPIAGLVAHWRLDEGQGTTSTDDTENSNEATLQNGAAFQAGGFPGARFANPYSLVLDGVDDYVSIVNQRLPPAEANQTIAFWVRYDAIPTSGNQAFVALYNSGARAGVEIGFRLNRLVAWSYGGTEMVGAVPPAPGWHHLAYTFNGTTHSFYVDGASVATAAVAATVGPVITARLGAHGTTGTEAFRGNLDDVRLYDRALGGGEITTLATGGQ